MAFDEKGPDNRDYNIFLDKGKFSYLNLNYVIDSLKHWEHFIRAYIPAE